MRLFAEKGYAACSIREICAAAGVTKPVLYYHFRSKEQLYRELMLDIFNQGRKNLLRLSNSRGALKERLVPYLWSEFRGCREDPDSVRFLLRMLFSPKEELPYFNFIEEFQRQRDVIAGFIRERIDAGERLPDPELTATALMGMMLIFILEYLFTGRQTLTRRNAERLVDLLVPCPRRAKKSVPIGKAKGGRR